MNNTFSKECLGIDVSKLKLDCCLSVDVGQSKNRVIASAKFENSMKGFKKLQQWLSQKRQTICPLKVVMEATGVYHQNATYHLCENGFSVCIVQPTKAKQYAKSLGNRSKTDKIDARMLAQLGLERELPLWIKPDKNLLKIKLLCRERVALLKECNAVGNQLHAICHSFAPVLETVRRIEKRKAFLKKQILQIEAQIKQIVDGSDELTRKINLVATIPGISFITAATVIAETDGFANINNRRQLVSFVGLDIVMKESGTLSWRPHLSKRGNSYIRAALYMNAVCSIVHNKRIKRVSQQAQGAKYARQNLRYCH